MALSAYLVHAIRLNVSLKKRQWILDSGRSLVVLLPVCSNQEGVKKEGSHEGEDMSVYGLSSSMVVSLTKGVHVTGNSERRNDR